MKHLLAGNDAICGPCMALLQAGGANLRPEASCGLRTKRKEADNFNETAESLPIYV